MLKNKKGEHFQYALAAIFLSIFVSLFAFVSESSKITGFAVSDSYNADNSVSQDNIREYKTINDLSSLAVGDYYIDGDGIVYWLDDVSKPAIGKVDNLEDSQKYRQIYVDASGDIGYVIQ